MSIREEVKRHLRRAGYNLHKFDTMHWLARRMLLLRHHGIDLIFDVGANVGQYASLMRRYGYTGRIVSFEPLAAPFATLRKKTQDDEKWTVLRTALGRASGSATMNVAAGLECSSFLPMTNTYLESAPEVHVIGTEEVPVTTLDAVFSDHFRPGDRPYLKLDVQGYEMHVLEGAAHALDHVLGVQMEMSLVAAYEGEVLFADMIDYMADRGFTLMSIEPVHATKFGQQLQVDGIFYRTDR